MPQQHTSSAEWEPPARQPGWQFWIDRGGTFTDLIARSPGGSITTTKLLSESPENYRDAAVEGIRRLLGTEPGKPLPLRRIEAIRMGTTVATNALLERRGQPTALVITNGFADQLQIGHQSRPRLFARQIVLPSVLHHTVIEARERVSATGEVLYPLDEERLVESFQSLLDQGYTALAIVFLHAWQHPQHEARAAELARRLGFLQVSVSHEVSPLMKIVPRGHTTVADAYLSPILHRYVDQLRSELHTHQAPQTHTADQVYFMKSDGGLVQAEKFRGKDSVLSGPAGGIVAMVRTALAAGFKNLIGFDMGGTSTDVSHFSGSELSDCERVFDSVVAGISLQAPMLGIHTIAAGGGSLLQFDGQRLRVGPGSAGSNPGPACYRRDGPLALTDANVALGKIQPDFFPQLFGPRGNSPIDSAAVEKSFEQLTCEVNQKTGQTKCPQEVAEGFVRVAVAKMAEAIACISVQRGYDLKDYTLVCFGGAGGQHACAVADQLGIKRIYLHPLSGLLSAYGMGLADITASQEQAVERVLNARCCTDVHALIAKLSQVARAEVGDQGIADHCISVRARVHLKYEGTDTALAVQAEVDGNNCDPEGLSQQFEKAYRKRFSFLMPNNALVVDSVSVEASGAAHALPQSTDAGTSSGQSCQAEPLTDVQTYARSQWHATPVYRSRLLADGQRVSGPALLIEDSSTIMVELGWQATHTTNQHLILERCTPMFSEPFASNRWDPIILELCTNRFYSIAEQMGVTLANTAHSVNIKERLDFSCALFDEQGQLVANAPHVPVHLGSMSESIQTVISRNAGAMQPGDVYALNDPYNGGTHLPDITLVMPVFSPDADSRLLFYVAARGHHADIGGITPGSMPPTSRNVEEEGVLIDNFLLVRNGKLAEKELRALLTAARYPVRNVDQNLADLRAQVAACEKGREQLQKMIEQMGLRTVQAYMTHVQDNAEESVRRVLAHLTGGSFRYSMDDGSAICVDVTIDQHTRSAHVDFSGTSAQRKSNFNAPPAVVKAAVMYVFRTLVDDDIPLNAGCLRPIAISLPAGSMLRPRYPAATVAGNVETSQCIVDALYGALQTMAASQGTMNNFTFGNKNYQYYETLAGGSGAGEGFDGVAAVQTHMTNSRLTDPEVLEHRFPVRIEEHSIRRGSGGKGKYRGGDGVLRRIRFLQPLTAAILSGRRIVPPYGMAGGKPGAVGKSWVERADGTIQPLTSCQEVSVKPGDLFVVSTPSGGGYGELEAAGQDS